MITDGTSCIITHDIFVGGQLAFRAWETVIIEALSPNPQRPESKYVVFSQSLQKRFQLSDADIFEVTGISGQPQITPQDIQVPTRSKPHSIRFNSRLVWGVVIAVVVVVVIVVVVVLSFKSEPEQKGATAAGKSTEEKAEKNLTLEKVGYLPNTDDGSSYRVVGKMLTTNPDYSVVGGTWSMTLYDAQNVILGTEKLDVVSIYPSSYRWLVSTPSSVYGQTPARAEIKINTDGCWKKTSEKSSGFEVIQKNYITGEYDSKITGVFRYSGKTLSKNAVIGITGVALNANGDPIGAGKEETGDITVPGDYPFEVSLSMPIPGVADTDVSVFPTGMRYIR